MLNQKIQDAVNDQINDEFKASHLYLAMSAWCERENFGGYAHWLRLQSEEERGHALKLVDSLNDWNGKVMLKGLPEVPSDWPSLAAVFAQVLKHEEGVSASIHRLYELAGKEKAWATQVQLQWFLLEQVEEEKTAREIVAKLQLAKDDPASLLSLDRGMAARAAK